MERASAHVCKSPCVRERREQTLIEDLGERARGVVGIRSIGRNISIALDTESRMHREKSHR